MTMTKGISYLNCVLLGWAAGSTAEMVAFVRFCDSFYPKVSKVWRRVREIVC